MSASSTATGLGVRGLQAAVLVVLFGLLLGVMNAGLNLGTSSRAIVSVGLLLLSGMLVSDLLGLIGLPHLTGYIAAGVLAGPYVSHIIDHETVASLHGVNTLALSLIALAGGLELRIEDLRKALRSIATAMVVQGVVVFVVASGMLYLMRPLIGFAGSMPTAMWLGVSLIWGVLSVSRSPSVTLAIMSQLKPQGPLSRFALGFVMSSDVVVVVLMATVLALVRPWIDPGSEISMAAVVKAGREIIGSVSIGTTLGLLLIVYLRVIGGQILLLLFVLSFVASEALHYLHFEPMLTFLCAGFVVQNMSAQGERLLHAIEETGSLVFVVFFATAGAHLNLPLLSSLWPVALALVGGRMVSTFVAHRVGSAMAKDEWAVRTWGWAPLISQAGLTLGLSAMVARQYPVFGEGFRALVIVTVALNEIIGPILFKLALERTGEIKPAMS